MSEVKQMTKVERSPQGLVSALFDSLDNLNNGTQTVEEVRAVCHTTKSIVNVARLEIEAARLQHELGRKVELTTLPGLGVKQVKGPQE
jgi:hypothetical protein